MIFRIIPYRLRIISTIFILIVLVFFFTESSHSREALFEGIWVTRENIVSPQKIDFVLDIASRYGFNNIFVQIRGRGDAFYSSTFVPQWPELKKGSQAFDPLEYIIECAHRRNIKVHTWFNIFLLWSAPYLPEDSKHLYYKHQEWFSKPSSPERMWLPERRISGIDGIYLSPGHEEVQLYLIGVIAEVLRKYKVDGVHMDYIRYPDSDYGYNEVMRKHFYYRFLVDPLELVNSGSDVIAEKGKSEYNNLQREWRLFRMQSISKFVERVSSLVQGMRDDILLTAAVKPQLEDARNRYYQDWFTWLINGWIDCIVPMNYTSHNERFIEIAKEILELVPKDRVLMGIGAYNQDKFQLAYKYFQTKTLGLKGYSLFSFNSIKQDPGLMELITR